MLELKERHILRLENFTLKHVNAVLLSNYNPTLHEVRKTHHQLIKRKVRKDGDDNKDNPIDSRAIHTYYSIGEILKQYGYFIEGLPDFSIELDDGSSIEHPYHKIRKSYLRDLSTRLSKAYKIKYKELPPIGYGGNNNNRSVASRINLYEMEPEYEQIIHRFMKEHPENEWFETDMLTNGRNEKINKKKEESKKRNVKRVDSYLEDKEYLVRRITRSKNLKNESKQKLLSDYKSIVEKCKKNLPKNKEMDVLFHNFRESMAQLSK